MITDPVDLLRALPHAEGSDRALYLEQLYLTKEAIQAWNELAGDSEEARQHLQRLQQLPDPLRRWSTEELDRAWERRDAITLNRIAREFPVDAARYFERHDLRDREGARLLAKALAAAGEHYPQAVVNAMDRTKDQAALDQGLAAMHAKDYPRAAALLERAGNPLSLAARYEIARGEYSLPLVDAIVPRLQPEYRELFSRIHAFRAYVLEYNGQYLAAHEEYKQALAAARDDPTIIASARARESFNFGLIGNREEAFRDAHRALSYLPRVADARTRNHAYGSATNAAAQLGHPKTALLYQNAAVADLQRAGNAKVDLSVAFRARAEIHVQLGNDDEAAGDLEEAADLAEAAAAREEDRDLLRMRRLEVQGQARLKSNPAEAAVLFSEAIELAKNQNPTYRALLYFQRGRARRDARKPLADEDTAEALRILREEVRGALTEDPRKASEPLWTPYFLRFRGQQDELIKRMADDGDAEGALVQDELARAFEPMQILLQSRSLPAGFRFIETRSDLQKARANLPEDTVILQYLVLQKQTFTWIVTRERVQIFQQRAGKDSIERWVAEAHDAAPNGLNARFTGATRAAYAELFREPLKLAAGKTRIVIIPDAPMQGFPFNALESVEDGYLIERASIATAGSMSLYLYALARDRQLPADPHPTTLLVAEPAPEGYRPIPNARDEVEELSRNYYPGAAMLTDADATVKRFLEGIPSATLVHFAGHAKAIPEAPWQSHLALARHGQESGLLTAQQLMQKLPSLRRTRLVVLSACSSAGGSSVGPQGLAPLVRPFIAANVPAVVGSLWDVNDASTKPLLVFLHCHYRHGDDVAVALRNAQLEMLRNDQPVRAWAAFQVVGYAASPYPRSSALEDSNSEHICTQNLLHRPDGLHPQ